MLEPMTFSDHSLLKPKVYSKPDHSFITTTETLKPPLRAKITQLQCFNDLDILHALTLSCHSLTPGTFGVLIPDL